MPRPSPGKFEIEREMWLQSLDDTRLRMLAKQRGIPDSDTLPRKYLLQQLMVLGPTINPLSTPKHDRRL
jgi:hypothetical protein